MLSWISNKVWSADAPDDSTGESCSGNEMTSVQGNTQHEMQTETNNSWICPSDRVLTLRARVKAGWCDRKPRKGNPKAAKANELGDSELEQIRKVLERADKVDQQEQHRIGKLVDKLQNMKRRAIGNGETECLVCGSDFGIFGPRRNAHVCYDCRFFICSKTCGIETTTTAGKLIFLCSLCSEERELHKKTNAWFFRDVPKYVLPPPSRPLTVDPRNDSLYSLPQSTSRFGYESATAPAPRSNLSSPRRRLPDTPTDQEPFRPKQHHPLPRWAAEPGPSKKFSPDRASSGSSEEEISGRKIIQYRRYRDNSDSEEDQTASPLSSHHESVPSMASPTSSQDHHDQFLHLQAHNDRSDNSDSRSIDSGVVHSDRSQTASSLQVNRSGAMAQKTSFPNDASLGDSGIDRTDIGYKHRLSITAREPSSSVDSVGHPFPYSSHLTSAAAKLSHTFDNHLDLRDRRESSGSETLRMQGIGGDSESLAGRRGLSAEEAGLLSSSSSFHDPAGWHDAMPTRSTGTEVRSSIQSFSMQHDNDELSSSPDDDLTSLGKIEFSLLYVPAEQKLVISLYRAENLRSMDQNGLSDPYVKFYLLPGAMKSTKLRSKTIPKCLNPVWSETLFYHGVAEEELAKKTLRVLVLDEDRFGSDFLGESRVELKKIRPNKERKFSIYLEKQMPVDKEDQLPLERGKILMSLHYNNSKQMLSVGVVRCVELLGMDPNGYSDPYVVVHLMPEKKHKHKTSVKKRTLNPVYNQEFTFGVGAADLHRRTLEVKVFDKDVGKSDDFLGRIDLCTTGKGDQHRHWEEIIKTPNKKIERWHKLTS